ncbi:GGDEF domain-containing protein [uncultured Hyphomonas sp.]|uniref:GGDEF domain-containing protein n=1 Tax=uncultured Hyphomonas sp. TaxID=225298 RepID=UPI002AAB5210|nr:GGDEF domain-containing protein [uncultured Hyphomonas sp.]
MQAAATAEAKPVAPPSNGAGLKQVFRNAQKAFDLIQKHRTPPEPKTYAVWYAYVEAADPRVVERVDSVIAENGTLTPFDIASIFRELLTEETGASARHTIGLAIEKEIDEVMKIIQQGVQNSDDFGASLDKANEELPGAASSGNIASLLSTLMEDNKRMAQTTRELNQGLMDSQKQIATLNKELEEVQTQCMRDPLTAIANRRAFDERLEREVRAAAETGEKLCLALADIDHFKSVNDTYGHQVGDAVLQQFAAVVTQNIKGQDMVARYGGEEFAVILPETDLFSAYNLLVKIKYNFKSSETPIEGTLKTIKDVTASFGLVRYEPGMTPRDMIEQADHFLYEAKNAGRDRVKAKGF